MRSALASAQPFDLHPRLGHRQPHAPRSGWRARRAAGAARRISSMRSSRDAARCAGTCCRGTSRCSTRWSANGCRSTSSTGARIGGSRFASMTSIRSGASHHQKVIVVDDAVAFVSGYDLTRCRWDTQRARARRSATRRPSRRPLSAVPRRRHRRRRRLRARAGRPRARALAARHRRASRTAPRRRTPRRMAGGHRRRPRRDVDVAIARTEPAFAGRPAVTRDPRTASRRDRRRAGATSSPRTSISRRGRSRARSRGGSQRTIRRRSPCCRRTRKAAGSRFRRWACCAHAFTGCCVTPIAAGATTCIARCCAWLDRSEGCLNIHSKVLIVDDALLMIGSSNLSDRSLALDTECNLDHRIARRIRG